MFALAVTRALPSLAALTALVLVAGGCTTTMGARSLRHSRSTYNVAIQQTNSEQLLLNLVRLRYRDAPLFLEVTSISSSLSLEVGASASGTIGPTRSATPGTAINYIERPTISYVPLQGTRFGQQFLSPVGLGDIFLLYHAGWAVDRIFKVFVQRLGPLQNAPRASGPTPDTAPDFDAYFTATGLLRSLWHDGLVDLRFIRSIVGNALVLTIAPVDSARARTEQLCLLLGLAEYTSRIVLTDSPRPGEPNAVLMVPRSLLGGMYYVSHGVEVPAEDYSAGRVPTTRDRDGEPYAWDRMTGSLLRVRHSRREPGGAYVSVFHRGLWFYIEDTDLDSKSTFSFITQVLELQSGEFAGAVPVLTLPIAAE